MNANAEDRMSYQVSARHQYLGAHGKSLGTASILAVLLGPIGIMYSSSAASIMTLFAWVTAVGGGLFAAIYGDIGYHAYAQSGGLENMPLPNASVVAAGDPVAGILVAVLLFTLVNVLVAVICAHQHNERVAANVTLAIELSTK